MELDRVTRPLTAILRRLVGFLRPHADPQIPSPSGAAVVIGVDLSDSGDCAVLARRERDGTVTILGTYWSAFTKPKPIASPFTLTLPSCEGRSWSEDLLSNDVQLYGDVV